MGRQLTGAAVQEILQLINHSLTCSLGFMVFRGQQNIKLEDCRCFFLTATAVLLLSWALLLSARCLVSTQCWLHTCGGNHYVYTFCILIVQAGEKVMHRRWHRLRQVEA